MIQMGKRRRRPVRRLREKTGKAIRSAGPPAMRVCMDYPRPGNIRELENAVEHAFVLWETDRIDLFDLPVEIRQRAFRPADAPETARQPLSPEGPTTRLAECGWNKAEAARRLGLSRTAVWKCMKKWGIPLKRADAESG